jgi:hypothetical protein
MPVAVASLDIDAAAIIVGGQQHRRLLAVTLPSEQQAVRSFPAIRLRGVPSLGHRLSPPLRVIAQIEIEHMF